MCGAEAGWLGPNYTEQTNYEGLEVTCDGVDNDCDGTADNNPPSGGTTVYGVGAGQMSRVDSVRLACAKAGERARGAVLASDAFFPFPDGVEVAIEHGVAALVEPGGSVRDEEVIAACDAKGVPMVFSDARHFRH